MTKEMTLLGLSTAQDNKASTNNSKESKKEGMSLFDSMLASSKESTSSSENKTPVSSENTKKVEEKNTLNTKENVVDDNKENINTDKKIETVKNAEQENKETSSKESTKDRIPTDLKQVKKENNEESELTSTKEKEEVKVSSSTLPKTTSLLDRMIIEGKKQLNSSEPEQNKESLVTPTQKNVDSISEVQDDNIINKNENSLIQKQITLTDIVDTVDESNENINKENITTSNKSIDITSVPTEKNLEENSEVDKNNISTQVKNSIGELLSSKENASLNEGTLKINDLSEESTKTKILNSTIDNEKNDIEEVVKTETGSKKEVDSEKKLTENKIIDTKKIQEPNEKSTEVLKNDKVKISTEEQKITKNSEQSNLINTEIKKQENITVETQTETLKIDNKITVPTEEKEQKENILIKETKNNNSNIENKEEVKKDNTHKNNISFKDEKSNIDTSESISTKKLSNLDSEALTKNEEKINLNKEEIKNTNSLGKNEEIKSDKKNLEKFLNDDKTILKKEDNVVSSLKSNENINQFNKKDEFLTNIYLGSQKNSINNQMLSNKNEALKVVKDGKSIEDIKQGAKKLDISVGDISISKEKDVLTDNLRKDVEVKYQRDNFIEKMTLNKNIKQEENIAGQIKDNAVNNTNIQKETTINITVSHNAALTIQNRIIGAQQQMSSMMSDVARSMYENYKPPITAFRINLFPAQLGQIAILMKSDKDNGLNISMNMTNSNTLDSFVENQVTLRDAINRNFNNPTTVNFEFSMQDENSSNTSSNNQQENKEKEQEQQHSSTDILEAVSENKDVAEDLNYM